MKDVFISYSRRDGVFARRLVERLAKQGLDSWVDWAGIPYSTEWWAEIRNGIDSAKNFVFIITPDSVTSRVCNLEVEYARQTNKRIIPLMRREPDVQVIGNIWEGADWKDTARANYQHLTQINWIFFRKRTDPEFVCTHDERTLETLNPECDAPESDFDEFDTAVYALLNVIRQDVHHVEQHTRLNVRARDWAAGPSGLLRGQELIDAEAWLAGGQDKAPQPTDLHRQFIRASREAVNRERRRVVTALSVGLVLALALAILSLIGFSNAETERGRADANAATSVANADLAGTQAFRADANAATSQANAEQAEFEAQRADANAATSDANADLARTQAFRADANAATSDANVILAVAAQETAIRRADEFGSLAQAASARLIRESNPNVALALAIEANQVAAPPALALKTLADIAYAPGMIRVFQENFAPIHDISLDPTGRYVVAGNWDGELFVWESATGEPVFSRTGGLTGIMLDSRRLAATDAVGGLSIWDIETGDALKVGRLAGREIVEDFAVGDQNRIAAHPGGKIIATGSLDGVITLWDIDIDKAIATFNKPSSNSHAIKRLVFRNGGDLLLSIDASGLIQAFSVPEQALIREFNAERIDVVSAADFHPSGSTAALYAPGTGEIVIVDVSSGDELRYLPALHGEHLLSLSYDATGERLLTASFDSTIIVRDALTNAVLYLFRGHLTDVLSANWSADGRTFVSGGYDGRAMLWDTQPGNRVASFAADGTGLSSRFSPRGDLLVTLGSSAVHLRSAATGETLRQFEIGSRPTAAIFNADGTRLLVGSEEGRLTLWDTQDGSLDLDVLAHDDLIADVFFLDGGRALTGSYDGSIRLIDLENEALLQRFRMHEGEISSLALSADGQTAASSSEMSINVWNTAGGAILHTLEAHQHHVSDLIFLEGDDHRWLASASPDELLIWDVDTGDLMRDLNRALTARTLPNLNVRSSLRIGPGGISVLATSPDGRLLASSRCGLFNDERCVEAEVSVWDARTLDLIYSFGGGVDEIVSLSVHPDMTRLAASGWRGTTTLWSLELTLAELLSWTEANRIPASLSCAEREAYDVALLCEGSTPTPTSTLHPTLTVMPTVDLVAMTATPTLPPTQLVTLVPTPTMTPTPDAAQDIRALDLPFRVVIPDAIPGHEVESWRYTDNPVDVFDTSRDLFAPGDVAVSLRFNRGGVYAGIVVQSASPYADLDAWLDGAGYNPTVFDYQTVDGVETALIVDPDLAIAIFIHDGVFTAISFAIPTDEVTVIAMVRVFVAG